MAYIKNNWVDREGTTRYFETVDSDGAKIFTPDYTQVTELGTPVNADNMNHIEEGIAAGSFTKFDLNTTYAKDDLVTVIEDSLPVIYKSLVDNNIGHALSSSIAWEKISLINAGRIEEKLVNKADTNASNFTTEGKSLISGLAMLSRKKTKLTLGASAVYTWYTAPANGWVYLVGVCTTAPGYVEIGTNNLFISDVTSATNVTLNSGLFPVSKGEQFCSYWAKCSFNRDADGLYFVYAKGSESEV